MVRVLIVTETDEIVAQFEWPQPIIVPDKFEVMERVFAPVIGGHTLASFGDAIVAQRILVEEVTE